MRFEIDPRRPTPPSEQITDQVRAAIAAGDLRPGDRLPSVRAAARESRVNPNTVSKAYRALEGSGFVELRRGAGVYVAPRARDACGAEARADVARRLRELLEDARSAGMTPAELTNLTASTLARIESTRRTA